MFFTKQDKSDSKRKSYLPKGSSTLFRVVYETHLNLSRQADHKAHLMLWINTMALSMLVSKHHKGFLWHVKMFQYPNLALVAVCLTGAVLAVLASRPILPRRPAELPPNWLFFGSFAVFPFSQFQENIGRLMRDEEALQAAFSQDILLLGRALALKYRYLALCYTVFGFGMPIVAVLYVLFWWMYH